MLQLCKFSDIVGGDEVDMERALRPRTWDVSPIIWANAQWAVTDYGLENIAGPCHYYINAADITPADRWVDHLSEKNWVLPEKFAEAHGYALRHFRAGART